MNVYKYQVTDKQRIVLGQCLHFVRTRMTNRIDRAPDEVDNLTARIALDQVDDLINLFDIGDVS